MPSDVRPLDLQRILDFIYKGEVEVPESEKDIFCSSGARLKIRGLEHFTKGGEIIQQQIPTGGQMVRKRPGPILSQSPKQNQQTKRVRAVMEGQMMSPSKSQIISIFECHIVIW